MRPCDVIKTTTDSSSYIKARRQIEKYFQYRKPQNKRKKWYGQSNYNRARIKDPPTYPNWKLVSKNPKQWIKKPIEEVPFINWWNSGFEIKWNYYGR
jgi:hypothetical protein